MHSLRVASCQELHAGSHQPTVGVRTRPHRGRQRRLMRCNDVVCARLVLGGGMGTGSFMTVKEHLHFHAVTRMSNSHTPQQMQDRIHAVGTMVTAASYLIYIVYTYYGARSLLHMYPTAVAVEAGPVVGSC